MEFGNNKQTMLEKALQQVEPKLKSQRNELQRTVEWFADRLGNITGTDAEVLMSGITTDKVQKLILQKVADHFIDTSNELFTEQMNAMAWGNRFEGDAIELYEKTTGSKVVSAKFHHNSKYSGSGSSVDGYVNDNGLIEVKCPYSSENHIKHFIFDDAIDKKYFLQIQKQLFDTDRQWCDFVSFDPRMIDGYKIFIKRIYPDAVIQSKFETKIPAIIFEIERKVELVKMYKK